MRTKSVSRTKTLLLTVTGLKGRFSSGWDDASELLLFCEIDGNWLSDLIKCTILQEEIKLVWEKSAQKLRKYKETYIQMNARGSPSHSRTKYNSRNSNLPMDTVAPWLASEPQSTGDAPLAHTYARCAYYMQYNCTCIVIHTQHSMLRTV